MKPIDEVQAERLAGLVHLEMLRTRVAINLLASLPAYAEDAEALRKKPHLYEQYVRVKRANGIDIEALLRELLAKVDDGTSLTKVGDAKVIPIAARSGAIVHRERLNWSDLGGLAAATDGRAPRERLEGTFVVVLKGDSVDVTYLDFGDDKSLRVLLKVRQPMSLRAGDRLRVTLYLEETATSQRETELEIQDEGLRSWVDFDDVRVDLMLQSAMPYFIGIEPL